MVRMFNDDLQVIWERKLSLPFLSPILSAWNRRQSKNSLQIPFNEKCQIVMYGAANVGKTTIVNQFLYDTFEKKYNPTVEDLHIADYNLSSGASLTLEILDTTGKSEFPSMKKLSLSRGNAFLLIYSVNDADSWKDVKALRHEIIDVRKNVPIVVAGNVWDGVERIVDRETVEEEIREWNCGYVECNAKENCNIVDVFKEILVQSNIEYDLTTAVSRRRLSMPAMPRKNRSRSNTRIGF